MTPPAALSATVAAGLLGATIAAAVATERKDLRDISVGEPIADLKDHGYAGWKCRTAETTLSGWSDWRTCPPEASGLRAIRFEYDETVNPLAPYNDRFQGTKVAGHPALLTAFVADDGEVKALEIETDPKARLFMRKKAFLLAGQVKDRYGAAGWTCTSAKPSGDEEPVGGLFIKDHCEKTVDGRLVVVDQTLLRHAGEDIKDFQGSTHDMITATR
jgi:hypothetical protein